MSDENATAADAAHMQGPTAEAQAAEAQAAEAQAAEAQAADAPFISEPLTWQQICERYPEEWVCLAEIDRPEAQNFAFRTARVIGHGKHPRDPLVQARAFHDTYDGMGHYFTGRIRPLLRLAVVE